MNPTVVAFCLGVIIGAVVTVVMMALVTNAKMMDLDASMRYWRAKYHQCAMEKGHFN